MKLKGLIKVNHPQLALQLATNLLELILGQQLILKLPIILTDRLTKILIRRRFVYHRREQVIGFGGFRAGRVADAGAAGLAGLEDGRHGD
jgi:hypothetical protein